MPGKAAKVKISENQQAILQTFVKARSSTVSLAQRSRIILLAFEGHNNESMEELVCGSPGLVDTEDSIFTRTMSFHVAPRTGLGPDS